MALLSHHRRYWIFAIAAVLLLPLFGLVLPDLPAPPGPVNQLPKAFWQRPTERVDPFLNSHFGFRGVLMAAHRLIAKGDTKQGSVLMGEAGQLFFTGDQAIEQALGLAVHIGRPLDDLERISRAMHAAQASRGGQFILASPPDVATIQADRLPGWMRAQQRHPTLYDLVLARLSRSGVNAVDLRVPLLEAKRSGPVYSRTDTHWNHMGSLVAFNATMEKVGRADLTLDPRRYLGPLKPARSGDLMRMTGQAQTEDDEDYAFEDIDRILRDLTALPVAPSANRTFQPYAYATGRAGPSIMIIGDSFTGDFWKGPIALNASRFAWLHHERCRFEWDRIANFRPDILVYAPTERGLGCQGSPRNFPSRTEGRTIP